MRLSREVVLLQVVLRDMSFDGGTAARARGAGVDAAAALADNDSHAFLSAAGDLIETGPTHTNVNDLYLAVGW